MTRHSRDAESAAGVVVGTLGSDCHVAGVRVLEHVLTKEGFRVVPLGVMNSQEDFIRAAIETRASALFISSIYGHGRQDFEGLRDKCREAGIGDILIYLGGNLLVDESDDWEITKKVFLELGADRVYPPETRPQMAIGHLRSDLERPCE